MNGDTRVCYRGVGVGNGKRAEGEGSAVDRVRRVDEEFVGCVDALGHIELAGYVLTPAHAAGTRGRCASVGGSECGWGAGRCGEEGIVKVYEPTAGGLRADVD